jgi:hypothetical protein
MLANGEFTLRVKPFAGRRKPFMQRNKPFIGPVNRFLAPVEWIGAEGKPLAWAVEWINRQGNQFDPPGNRLNQPGKRLIPSGKGGEMPGNGAESALIPPGQAGIRRKQTGNQGWRAGFPPERDGERVQR